jgi:multiple sugar transport system substrate-binding protein
VFTLGTAVLLLQQKPGGIVVKKIIATLLLALVFTFSISAVSLCKDPVTIKIWIASQPAAVIDWLQVFAKEFNEANPDIVVDIEHYSNVQDLRDKVIVSTAAGIGPDLFYEASNNISRWIISGLAEPIDKYFNAKPDKNDFIPDILNLVRYKGQTYGMPFVMWPIFSLYNLDLFAQGGVTEPQNWDEMITAARKLTRTNGNTIETFGWRTAGTNNTLAFGDLQLSMEQLGSTTIPIDGLQATMNTPEGLLAMRYLQDLRDAGMPGSNGGNQMKDVYAGKVAIQHWASTNVDFLQTLQTSSTQGLNFGMRRFVGPTPGTDMIVAFAGVLVMSSVSKNPNETWRVLDAFVSPENMRSYLVAREFNQTVRRSQAVDPVLLRIPYQKELMQLMHAPLTTSGSKHPYYPQFRDAVGKQLVDALMGRQSVEAALKEGERLLNAIVASENAANNNFIH